MSGSGTVATNTDTAPPARAAASGPLGRSVRQARARCFVGRADELAVLDAALRGDAAVPSVFYVHGAGGIGKSALLRRVVDGARRDGRPVVEMDGRFLEPSAAAFEVAAAAAYREPRAVLAVDSFEQCQWLEPWLRERFLPRLADDVVVVLAGRRPPDLEWTVDPGWRQALRVLRLEPLDRTGSMELLDAAGVEPARREAIVRFAGGNPLALSLAAAVRASPSANPATWTPSTEVLGSLLARLVGEVPSRSHRRALEAVAQACSTTEDLLQAALPDEDATALFAWLRELPFVESGPRGLYPHDAVREALAADLRWRDPRRFHDMRTRLSAALLRRLRDGPEHDALATAGALLYLYRDDPSLRLPVDTAPGTDDQVEDEPLDARDLPFVLALTAAHEGAESTAVVRHWFARQPEAFRLYRAIDTGEPVAFSARLRLGEPADPDDLAADAVVAATWRYCRATAPLSAGEHFAVTRFTVDGRPEQHRPPVMRLMLRRSLASVCRSTRLTYGFLVFPNPGPWPERLGDRVVDTGERPVVGSRSYAVLAHDWRRTPFERWLDPAGGPPRTTPSPRAVGRPAALPDEEFGRAVQEALRLYRHDGGLVDSPLATTLLPADVADADEALRAVLRHALTALRTNWRQRRGHDAVVATYLSGTTTQQAAARRLQVPFGTYRRHLKQGVQDLTGHLWEVARRPGATTLVDAPQDGEPQRT